MSRFKKGGRFRMASAPKSLCGQNIYKIPVLDKDKLFTCSECGRKFMTQLGLENHLANYHGIFKEAV
jgi:hypothetical protein